jgi:hypothetical protein
MMSDEQVAPGARKPYHPPVIDDLGSLRELTAGAGFGGAPFDGAGYVPAAPPPPHS